MSGSHRPRVVEPDECALNLFQRIGITGEITIIPTVECGPISVTCLSGRIESVTENCDRPRRQKRPRTCKILVHQELCIEVPVTFNAQAHCELQGIHCGEPSTDPRACGSGSDDLSGSGSDSGSDSDSGSGSDSGSDSDSGSGSGSGSETGRCSGDAHSSSTDDYSYDDDDSSDEEDCSGSGTTGW